MKKHLPSPSLDFNVCSVTNVQAYLAGRTSIRTIPFETLRPIPGVLFGRCVLALLRNGFVAPVYIIQDGQLRKPPMIGGIFYNGEFNYNTPEFFTACGLNQDDYEVVRICEEFNSTSTPFTTELGIENTFSTNNHKLNWEELAVKIRSIIDLKYSHEVYTPTGQAEYAKIISTQNAIACRDNSGYLMPCTVEFKNNVKTICFCFVRLDLGLAIPLFFLDSRLIADNEKLLKKIINIRPLIVSPVGADDVVVSEGLKLRFISQQDFELIINSAA